MYGSWRAFSDSSTAQQTTTLIEYVEEIGEGGKGVKGDKEHVGAGRVEGLRRKGEKRMASMQVVW